MAERYFEQALHNFIKDFNYAGAIDHLADRDYTLPGIRDRIGAHLPDSYLRDQILKSYLDHGKLLLGEPGTTKREKISMIKETNAYGRVSYRQVREIIDQPGFPFSKRQYIPERNGSLEDFLWRKMEEGRKKQSGDSRDKKQGNDQRRYAYISLQLSKKFMEEWARCLDRDQLDYLDVFSDLKQELIYLFSDQRVRNIISCLYDHGLYQGYVFFTEQNEKWRIE